VRARAAARGQRSGAARRRPPAVQLPGAACQCRRRRALRVSAGAVPQQPCCCRRSRCRYELQPQGIKVVLLKPGAVKTPIWDKSLEASEAVVEGLPEEAKALYGTTIKQVGAGGAVAGRLSSRLLALPRAAGCGAASPRAQAPRHCSLRRRAGPCGKPAAPARRCARARGAPSPRA
jgi:hypothetical protein